MDRDCPSTLTDDERALAADEAVRQVAATVATTPTDPAPAPGE